MTRIRFGGSPLLGISARADCRAPLGTRAICTFRAGDSMPYCGAGSGLDRGVELLRRDRVRQKNPHRAVWKAQERDRELLASTRIARQKAFRGFRDTVENVGGLL